MKVYKKKGQSGPIGFQEDGKIILKKTKKLSKNKKKTSDFTENSKKWIDLLTKKEEKNEKINNKRKKNIKENKNLKRKKVKDESEKVEENEEEKFNSSNRKKKKCLKDSNNFFDNSDDEDNSKLIRKKNSKDKNVSNVKEKLLDIEKKSIKLDKKKEKIEEEAEKERQRDVMRNDQFKLPSLEELLEEKEKPIDMVQLDNRIKNIIAVLHNFKVLKDENSSRSQYTEQLCRDLCEYYNYNEFLMFNFFKIFGISEICEALEANEVSRPMTIRVNTLKSRRRNVAQSLISRGVNCDPLGKWSKEGLVIFESPISIGATPEYLSGQYIVQSASSFLPVIALQPHEGDRILDMCAAPGGKSSHCAALMKNTGIIFANDSNKQRTKALAANFHRMGVQNSIICNYEGKMFPQVIGNFDRVILDAPCTGTGIISKDPSVKSNKTSRDLIRIGMTQRKLLLHAIDSTNHKSKNGGVIVYSTCSILVQENEEIVNYALKKRKVRLVDTGIDFGIEGFTSFQGKHFHKSLKLTRRYYPHTHNMDGFFVAKFKKFGKKNSVLLKSKNNDVK